MIDETMREAEDKMGKAITVAKEDFSAIRTGRANPTMFNKILADYYGTPTPVNQLASFHSPESSLMVVTPVRQGSAHGDREGDPRLRPRSQPGRRRYRHPRARSRP